MVGSSDGDGLFEQESGAQKHDRSSRGAESSLSLRMSDGGRAVQRLKARLNEVITQGAKRIW